jgi:methyl-accepting chemotaxis protein
MSRVTSATSADPSSPSTDAGEAEPKDNASQEEEVSRRFLSYLRENYEDNDFRFAILMTVQWAAAVVAAYVISPHTWAGTESAIHIHVYAAVFLGGLISAPPAVLAWMRPGTTTTRHLIAVGQLLMSGLLIHLSGGRIETHFHVFASLAFLSLYHDWRVLITGATVTAIDHAVRGIVWPQSIYGVLSASPWRTAEHAAWVVFTVAFLAVACVQAVRMYRRRAQKEIEAERKNERLDALLQDVEEAKAEAEEKRKEAAALAKQSEAEREYLEAEVERMLTAMDQFSSGDLTARFERGEMEDASGDERTDAERLVERLGDGFNRSVENMREILTAVDTVVDETGLAARQAESSAAEISEGVERQSAQADEVTTAIKEMSQTISSSASYATQAAEGARENGQQAEEGTRVVKEAVQKMHEIADVVQNSAETVKELGEASAEIEEVVAIINEIADQTNLLALNAAIEAARAGEEGQGFAVVADEVRELAERTTKATSNISSMVDEIQKKSNEAVSAMQRGKEQVRDGMTLADEAGNALDEIVRGTKEAADTISEIATATEEQSATSDQITESMQNISEVSHEAVTDTQKIAEATENMKEQADRLGQLIEQFTFAARSVPDGAAGNGHAAEARENASAEASSQGDAVGDASTVGGDGAPSS